ncbi:PH domain-containing protein [Rhizohabitans arisaemae]|uniref:PH domain-containing protein n=1 Tax=Rhizohabitans arisaemae TaxID=2720610 RepID=UPI0024B1C7E0|nr:PH domain-containing protein [Rhizohabitans arisaemae]
MDEDVLEWRVARKMIYGKAVLSVLFAVAAGFSPDPFGTLLAAVAAIGVGALAVRDVVAPVRLAVDGEGLTVVRGFAGRRRIAWDQVKRIRVDVVRRHGLRSELLEIDTGDDVHFLGKHELDAPCGEVAETLRTIHESR